MTAAHVMPEPTSVWADPEPGQFTSPWVDPERADRLQAEIEGLVNALGIAWPTQELAPVASPYCPQLITRTMCGTKVSYRCTNAPGHDGPHEARGDGDTVLARMALRKPSPKKRAA